MTKPAALVSYDNVLAGSQMVNRLQDLGYQVHLLSNANTLVDEAKSLRPLVFVVNLTSPASPVNAAIQALKSCRQTSHIPVVVFTKAGDRKLAEAARLAGANLVTGEAAILTHLEALLDRVLEVE